MSPSIRIFAFLKTVGPKRARRERSTLVLAITLLLCTYVHAATLRVPLDHDTLSDAIAAAKNGDRVVVAPGVYRASNMRLHGKAITIESQKGPDVTIIESDGFQTPIFWIYDREGPRTVIRGFTFRGGEARYGGAISIYVASPTISGNVFDSNVEDAGGYGAAIGCEGNVGGTVSAPLIVGNVFRNNSCDGQWDSGVVACVNYSSPRIVDNLFVSNPCAAINVSVIEGSRPEISNNTIVGNYVGVRLGAIVNTNLHMYRNNIITENMTGVLVDFSDGFHDPTWLNNLVYGNATEYSGMPDQTGINGNVNTPAGFVDSANGDYHLTDLSPAVDAGTNVPLTLPSTDMDGRTRIVDGNSDGEATVDMGAYEFRDPVGGSVTGVGVMHVVCKNLRTKRRVVFDGDQGLSWNCEAAGLAVGPGDRVATWAIGGAVGGADDVVGVVTGMSASRAQCTNLETGRHVEADLQGHTTWSCRDLGLAFRAGDRVRAKVQGSAY